MSQHDAERLELQRALELLGRNTRPARLLDYIGEKYLQHQEKLLTEYHIAEDVFGRSAKSFDAGQDAVVRVEAHRLRKRLREIYEKGGGPGGLQISLPAGTYVPQFTRVSVPHPAQDPLPVIEAVQEPVTPKADPQSTEARPANARNWIAYLSVAVLMFGAAVFGVLKFRGSSDSQAGSTAQSPATGTPAAIADDGKLTELHMMAGYRGSEVIDNSGVRWTPDRFFLGGASWPNTGRFVRRTSRPFLFSNWRNGEFAYEIPVRPGVYELRLFFVSPLRIGDEKLISFDVSMGGKPKPLLTAFDVNIDAQGTDVADEKVFRDISPDADGFVRLRFTNQIGPPQLNALEIVPGIPHKQIPIRIITQPTSFVDHEGQRWRADDYYLNGLPSTERQAVTGTEDPELFGAERFGHFNYAIPVDTRGRYTVILHFAEFFFGSQSQSGGVGSRVFHVFCNGKTLLENFDVYKEGGSRRVVTKIFSNIKPTAQGKINLTFEPVVNNATVSAIEVIDESE
jgi:hypothetical protein